MTIALPTEEEIAERCGGSPLVAVILLLDADPDLRWRFRVAPARVLDEFGLGCPADFIGLRGRACPAMPAMPGGCADDDIADPYWSDWLRVGVDAVDPYRGRLRPESRLPERTVLTAFEWKILVARVKSVVDHMVHSIDDQLQRADGEEAAR